ncbi:crotonobetainyl-CoA:carnitine CoA-transferase CaiB-like acyl-CoA transferase [Stella humosa]|uniref:Crotonobetainyl-CoA:carnitine CoA-transferase CaiB-like acyl-CoA transferase n=1 Tax=Stella humosa TaxID=94 RepID=A0A3N1KZ69_9PROT|nr:CoA transferase [Stella humosa]ROP84089.1 crotonobetainyl-CoA:carnitine CoA-transferase CaiB-like acyl-CoA transferase [Stella humosa]BBK33601.1 CoA transferase [Stella humosa]
MSDGDAARNQRPRDTTRASGPRDTTLADGPLGGLRIVDLTSVIMGPFATHILADLGADVIKVEAPEGDSLRHYRPLRSPGMAGNILNLHRNKRSIVLDLKSADGRQALDRLIATADVLVHSLRPATIGRLGYDYERVRRLAPDIIYCGAYGFGADGPYADKAAYDDLIQAGSGLADLHGRVHGEPGYAPTVVCDKLAGQAIATAVTAALLQRERGGGGQAIEVPMMETAIEFNLVEHMFGFAFEPPADRAGFPRVLNRQRRPYRTADGWACILPYSDRNWSDFYAFIGRPEFANDPRFATLPERVANIGVLYGLIVEEAPNHTTAEWVAFCDRASIPCMPVLALDDLPDDRHIQAVGLFTVMEHPTEGAYRAIRRPVNYSAAPFRIRRHAPRLGQHTAEVLAELGLGPDDTQHPTDTGAEQRREPTETGGNR